MDAHQRSYRRSPRTIKRTSLEHRSDYTPRNVPVYRSVIIA
jgi:hypothetical protein